MDEIPPTTTKPLPPPGAAPAVTDRRPSPRGVLPRGVQTWLLAGLAAFMLLIMFAVGRPDAPPRSAPAPAPLVAPTADRVRDYQDRLRALETQAVEQLAVQPPPPVVPQRVPSEPTAPPPVDPLESERRRREYESLFASNVVLSRRPESERPDIGRQNAFTPTGLPTVMPTVDDIADAALRATVRAAGGNQGQLQSATQLPAAPAAPPATASTAASSSEFAAPERTGPISAAGPLHPILEGTLVDAVLTNRLDGTSAAPVNCLVTNPLYSHSGQHVLIPAGARLLGETKPVQSLGETRLAVAFHRLLMPDGRTYRLDQFTGLNQVGDAGLKDRVNHHYLATFGAAAAVGLISGLSQMLGSVGRGDGDNRTVIVAGGAGDATSQATMQVMNRFLNRLPTVTIHEGHRVKVYLTSDLELPAYAGPRSPASF